MVRNTLIYKLKYTPKQMENTSIIDYFIKLMATSFVHQGQNTVAKPKINGHQFFASRTKYSG